MEKIRTIMRKGRYKRMTKREQEKCRKLMEEAVISAEKSKELWRFYEENKDTLDTVTAEIKMRDADQHCGYAQGIHQALSVLGFKHEGMKILADLI